MQTPKPQNSTPLARIFTDIKYKLDGKEQDGKEQIIKSRNQQSKTL